MVPGTAKIAGRGVITSRTTLSPNSTAERTSSRSLSSMMPSSWPASISASTASELVASPLPLGCGSARAAIDSRNCTKRVIGKDQPQQQPQQPAPANNPRALGSGEEGKGQQPIEQDDDKDDAEDNLGNLRGAGLVAGVASVEEQHPEDQGQEGQRQVHQDRRG